MDHDPGGVPGDDCFAADPEWAAALEELVTVLFAHARHRLGEKGVRFDAGTLIEALEHERGDTGA